MKFIINCSVSVLLCFWVIFSVAAQDSTYRAAVVAFTPNLIASKPLDRLYNNVASYLSFIDQAGKQNSDIIVFPEDGLTGWFDVITYPSIVEVVSTPIPDPHLNILPCTDTNKKYSKAFIDFSCSALKNKIYVVVNLVEQLYDNNQNTYVYFNTDVVFNKNGRVVAKYRKINLLNENLFLRGNKTSFFTTDFGVTFALFTCFDIVFNDPALKVLTNLGVTDILYPVAWFSHLPFLQGMSIHHGYAVSNKLNLLAAGLHDPELRNGGTAIYLADGKIAKNYINGEKGSHLLITDIPKISSRNTDKSCQETEPTNEEILNIASFKTSSEDMTNYTHKLIDLTKRKISENICSGENYCCTFDIDLEAKSNTNYVYQLVAYHGTVQLSETDRLGTRNCGIVACKNNQFSSCGRRHDFPPSGVTFKKIVVKGVFKSENSHDQPSTLRYDLKPLTNYTFCKIPKGNGNIEITLSTTAKQNLLLTFGIYGRVFSNDGKYIGAIEA
ncbi:hypothetical protein FQR65_LT03078 [Abscondita terminalis]|nr:hypothetical protein FQR65_LT03078 [Abscondita terminalis]